MGYQKIVIPVLYRRHWLLMVFYPAAPAIIVVYDSLIGEPRAKRVGGLWR